MKQTPHERDIIHQFSKQAIPFADLPGHLSAMQTLVTMSNADINDTVLDVACGPGLVACEFAPRVRHVEGIDITTAMIEQAQTRQNRAGLKNITWRIGTVDPLPYDSNCFSIVMTRYSFHHFTDPHRVFEEMIRVCRPGGSIVIADVVLPPSKVAVYDRMETMRDPSHVHALARGEMDRWFRMAGLYDCQQSHYTVDVELEAQLRASFPETVGKQQLREVISSDIGKDCLGINVRRRGNDVWLSYPISIYAGRKAH